MTVNADGAVKLILGFYLLRVIYGTYAVHRVAAVAFCSSSVAVRSQKIC